MGRTKIVAADILIVSSHNVDEISDLFFDKFLFREFGCERRCVGSDIIHALTDEFKYIDSAVDRPDVDNHAQVARLFNP